MIKFTHNISCTESFDKIPAGYFAKTINGYLVVKTGEKTGMVYSNPLDKWIEIEGEFEKIQVVPVAIYCSLYEQLKLKKLPIVFEKLPILSIFKFDYNFYIKTAGNRAVRIPEYDDGLYNLVFSGEETIYPIDDVDSVINLTWTEVL